MDMEECCKIVGSMRSRCRPVCFADVHAWRLRAITLPRANVDRTVGELAEKGTNDSTERLGVGLIIGDFHWGSPIDQLGRYYVRYVATATDCTNDSSRCQADDPDARRARKMVRDPQMLLSVAVLLLNRIRVFATAANQDGKHSVDYIGFAKEWNKTADAKTRFYITTEVLVAGHSASPCLLELLDNDAIPQSIDLATSRHSDMFEPVPPEAGFAQPSSSRVPAYRHPDYIPSQFLRREVAADFQNRSINPGSEMRYDAMLPLPPMVDPIRNEPPRKWVRKRETVHTS
ncbi:hypothetical protein DFH08DRAFT_931110 [Mycena albidolilacea]|uniref:Uncharacterized protein n=1 Tax=Mycena albidolilacea TaxID=1033008 RepID=A0AAD7AJC0_9AGAR|nr:hypothetical protein DFH08DRAFT_931110 [Mycena albidolilacea]